MLIVSAADRALLTLDDDRKLAVHADLSGLSANPPNNEIVVDGRGNVYVDGGGFDMLAGEPFGTLGGPEMRTLFVIAREWHGGQAMGAGDGTGQVLAIETSVPKAGWP